jgi:N6-adenosine-specific RNA methylase IME4
MAQDKLDGLFRPLRQKWLLASITMTSLQVFGKEIEEGWFCVCNIIFRSVIFETVLKLKNFTELFKNGKMYPLIHI